MDTAGSSRLRHNPQRAGLGPAAMVAVSCEKSVSRRAKRHRGRVRSEGGKKEKQSCEHQSQRRRRGGDASGTRAEMPLQPVERPCQSRQPPCSPWAAAGGYFVKELWPLESPHWSRGKVRKKEQQRGAVMDRPQAPIAHSPAVLLGVGIYRSSEWSEAEPGRKAVREKVF